MKIPKETETETETDGSDLVSAFEKENRIHRYEGETGLDNLSKLIEAIGYKAHGFKYGSALEVFLCDNPGACDLIVSFITECIDTNPEWKQSLIQDLEPEGDMIDDEIAGIE